MAPKEKKTPTTKKKIASKKKAKSANKTVKMKSKLTEKTMTQTTANPFEGMFQEASKSAQAQNEAALKCIDIFTKGSESLFKSNADFMKAFTEKQMKYMNDSLKVTTLNEWAETQNEIAQENFNDLMKQATVASEQCVKLTTEALEPLNEQINQAVKKATKQAA